MLKYYATLYIWIAVAKTTKMFIPMLTTSVENETIKWDGKLLIFGIIDLSTQVAFSIIQ